MRFKSGSKAKDGEEKKKKKERLNDGNNNGQATHGPRKHAWHTQAVWANFLTKFLILLNLLFEWKDTKYGIMK